MINKSCGEREEIIKALEVVMEINWKYSYKGILEQIEGVKDDYKKEKDGESIKRTENFVENFYFNKLHQDFCEYFGDNILEDIIRYAADWLIRKPIQKFCKYKALEIKEEQGEDIVDGDKYIYMMAAVIICESSIYQVSE